LGLGDGAFDLGPVHPGSGDGAVAVFIKVDGPEVFITSALVCARGDDVADALVGRVIDDKFDDFRIFDSAVDLTPAEALDTGFAWAISGNLDVFEAFTGFGISSDADTDDVFPLAPMAERVEADALHATALDRLDRGGSGFCFRTFKIVLKLDTPISCVDPGLSDLVGVKKAEGAGWLLLLRLVGFHAEESILVISECFGVSFVGFDFWFDALPMRNDFPDSGEGELERVFGRGEILFELIGREEEGSSGGVEAVVGFIGWKVRDIGSDSEE